MECGFGSSMVDIPNKSSFKINEVCALTGVKSYVLRFWESEFTEIAPMTSSSGVKLYEHKDLEAILLIKKLLFEDKLTIEKAKSEIKKLISREKLVEDVYSENNQVDFEEIGDTKKLFMAKAKISSMIDLANSIYQKNNWT